jgi:hypothetical protein
MVAPPKKAEDTSKAPDETSFVNPLYVGKAKPASTPKVVEWG